MEGNWGVLSARFAKILGVRVSWFACPYLALSPNGEDYTIL
jgi:hypothetical protein